MRRALHQPTGQEFLARDVPASLSAAPKGDWRCPNPACGEPCAHVPATAGHVAYFKHTIGVADLETCYYFAEEKPTQRKDDCVALIEGDLIHRYGSENVMPEAWVKGLSYPLDALVKRPDGQRWGFWYVSPRRASMTVNLLKQAAAAGVLVTIFTHVDARKPPELFEAKLQQAFFLDPDTDMLVKKVDHKDLMAPLELWQFGDDGVLIPPVVQPPPPPPLFAPRPAKPGEAAQAMFVTDPEPVVAVERPAAPAPPVPLPPRGRGRAVWKQVDKSQVPGDLDWIIQAPAAEWAPQLLQWFLGKSAPFLISQSCQFIAQRWRLHPSLRNHRDLVFLRAMHEFWQILEQDGLVKIVEHPHPIYVHPQPKGDRSPEK